MSFFFYLRFSEAVGPFCLSGALQEDPAIHLFLLPGNRILVCDSVYFLLDVLFVATNHKLPTSTTLSRVCYPFALLDRLGQITCDYAPFRLWTGGLWLNKFHLWDGLGHTECVCVLFSKVVSRFVSHTDWLSRNTSDAARVSRFRRLMSTDSWKFFHHVFANTRQNGSGTRVSTALKNSGSKQWYFVAIVRTHFGLFGGEEVRARSRLFPPAGIPRKMGPPVGMRQRRSSFQRHTKLCSSCELDEWRNWQWLNDAVWNHTYPDAMKRNILWKEFVIFIGDWCLLNLRTT